MKPPAETLDGAKIIYWAWSGDKPFFVMPDGAVGVEIFGLAICKYSTSTEVYRFSCDQNWEVQNDTDFDTDQEAMKGLSSQYDIEKVQWNKYGNA